MGEALGQRWRDLNLSEGVAYITQALQRIRGGGYVMQDSPAPKWDAISRLSFSRYQNRHSGLGAAAHQPAQSR